MQSKWMQLPSSTLKLPYSGKIWQALNLEKWRKFNLAIFYDSPNRRIKVLAKFSCYTVRSPKGFMNFSRQLHVDSQTIPRISSFSCHYTLTEMKWLQYPVMTPPVHSDTMWTKCTVPLTSNLLVHACPLASDSKAAHVRRPRYSRVNIRVYASTIRVTRVCARVTSACSTR